MTERERLIELIGSKVCEDYSPNCDEWQPPSCEKCYANDCSIGELADYLLANGVIVPPCKVGDNVYWIDNEKIKSCEVFEISIHSDGILIHTGIQFCLKPDAVYYTKEEAEQALKGGEG